MVQWPIVVAAVILKVVSLQLTSLLHEDKELIQKLLSLRVVIQFVKLEIEEWTESTCCYTVLYQIKQKKKQEGSFVWPCDLLDALERWNEPTLAKSRDGSPRTFPPSFSSAQMVPPLCKHTHTQTNIEHYNVAPCKVLQLKAFIWPLVFILNSFNPIYTCATITFIYIFLCLSV